MASLHGRRGREPAHFRRADGKPPCPPQGFPPGCDAASAVWPRRGGPPRRNGQEERHSLGLCLHSYSRSVYLGGVLGLNAMRAAALVVFSAFAVGFVGGTV